MQRLARLTAAALVSAALAMPVLAQDDRSPAAGGSTTIDKANHMSLDFPGGTLEEFARTVKDASDAPLNVLFTPGTGQIQAPPIELIGTNANDALMALVAISERTPLHTPDGKRSILSADRIGRASMIILIDSYDAGYAGSEEEPEPIDDRKTAIHSITELVTGSGAMTADDVLSALQAAMAMEGDEEDAKLAFHEGTGLVFARVTHDQGRVIEQTLMNLGRSMEARRRSVREESDREAQEHRTQNLFSQVQMLSSQNSKLKSRIAHLETLLRSRLNGEDAVPENPLGDEPTEGGN